MNDLIFEKIHENFFSCHTWPLPKGGWVTIENYYCVVYDHPVSGDRIIERYIKGTETRYISMEDKKSINLALDEIV